MYIRQRKGGAPVVGYSFSFDLQKSLNAEQKQTMESKRNNTKIMKNKFNDFPQNVYDFDKLEEELLSNKGV